MARGVPKRDGSGRGRRANRGRGGCATTESAGRGRRSRPARRVKRGTVVYSRRRQR